MYSRKNYRPVLPPSGTPSDMLTERVSPPPDYAGVAFITSTDRAAQDFPEAVIEPPENEAEPSEPPTEETVCLLDQPVPEPPCGQTADCPSEPSEQCFAPAPEPLPESEPSETDKRVSEAPSTSPIEWLRALKIEDLLLFWMLLMLLYGERRDEIELLLGLLLFTGG